MTMRFLLLLCIVRLRRLLRFLPLLRVWLLFAL
jgi:hypothetical protein